MKPQYQLNELFKNLNLPEDPTIALGNSIVFHRTINQHTVEIKTFSITEHSKIVHRWCNMAYSKRFWNMETSYVDFVKDCLNKAKDLSRVQYMLFFNSVPVACFEVYQVLGDILAGFVNADINDYGLHLMMAPYREIISQLENLDERFSAIALSYILKFLFEETVVNNLWAEPDRENGNAYRLAERTGFRFVKEITLPEKVAKLYCLNRNDYFDESLHLR